MIFQPFLGLFWRRLSESDRSSEFCRLVPYRLAKAPYLLSFGAEDENRTRILTLGRLHSTTKLLPRVYLVIYFYIIKAFKWSGKRGSNPWPSPWQGDALSTELFPHVTASNQKQLLCYQIFCFLSTLSFKFWYKNSNYWVIIFANISK